MFCKRRVVFSTIFLDFCLLIVLTCFYFCLNNILTFFQPEFAFTRVRSINRGRHGTMGVTTGVPVWTLPLASTDVPTGNGKFWSETLYIYTGVKYFKILFRFTWLPFKPCLKLSDGNDEQPLINKLHKYTNVRYINVVNHAHHIYFDVFVTNLKKIYSRKIRLKNEMFSPPPLKLLTIAWQLLKRTLFCTSKYKIYANWP